MSSLKAEYRQLLKDAKAQGWEVDEKPKGGGYPRILCPCPAQHAATVHLTPKRHYYRNKRTWLKNHTCWEEEAPR